MLFPNFWLKPKLKPSIVPIFLYPVSLVWILLGKIKQMLNSPTQNPIPVICVGNITIGGNGKTPTAIKLRCLLRERGFNPHIVTRGYRARLKGPHLVDKENDTHVEVGDEALMMSATGPTWISRNRKSGIKSAYEAGANIIILDDGFQNNSIIKDCSILVIDASIGFGNGYIIPAGPLRETVPEGLKKANLILVIGETGDQNTLQKEISSRTKLPIFEGILKPENVYSEILTKPIIGFAGISHPKKFQSTLEALGTQILTFKAFPNHKPLNKRQLQDLLSQAKKNKALLVTTEKDFVRISPELQDYFKTLEIDLKIKNQKIFIEEILLTLAVTD